MEWFVGFSLLPAVKAIVAEVWQPTVKKQLCLRDIVQAWRSMAAGKTYADRRLVAPELCSAFARNRFKSRGEDDPVYLAHYDLLVKLVDRTRHCKVWVRIPYKPRNPIWLPLRMSGQAESILRASELHDSKLVRGRDGRFWMHFTVTREVTPIQPKAVLAVDLGERCLATTVLLDQAGFKEPRFYGKQARGIRRHYSWLRRRLGERKLLRVIRKVKNSESRKINTLCHQISHAIVKQAVENKAVIVLGDLKGMRSRAKGKRFNRIVSGMPYHKLSNQIEYKARWEGIPVAKTSERDTSRTCHRCGSKNTSRIIQPILECHSCGLIHNADLNGAMNIAERFWDQRSQNGAPGSAPITLPERGLNVDEEKGSEGFHQPETSQNLIIASRP